jgi:hypothetical protein
MKLLIIAGPYEADQIRRAAVSAGFETVAIEPGESLSGWISATRPDLIVMAPQIVNRDPNVALAKVRSTPRGRVPIFFVGDAADEARLRPLADGFFVRPIAPADLVEQARARVFPSHDKSGPIARPPSSPAIDSLAGGTPGPGSGPHNLPALGLKPLKASHAGSDPGPSSPQDLLRDLADSIDASFDAEMHSVARGLVSEAASAPSPAVAELRDEGGQRTQDHGAAVPAAGAAPVSIRDDAAGTPAPYDSGTIGTPDIAILLGRIHTEQLSGRLTFRRGLAKKTIYFERGAPVYASSNLPEDRMGEMLSRQGRLTREQRAKGSQILETTGRRIGGVLVELGALKESELAPLVRRHYEEITYSVFAWPEGGDAPAEDGEWTMGPERLDEEEPIRLDEPAPALVMEGIRRKYTTPRLLRRLGGGTQVMQLLVSGTAASAVLDDMGLSDEERTAVRRFDGVRTLDEIRAAANVGEDIVCGVAWALVSLRLASVTRAVDAETTLPKVALAAAGNGTVHPAAASTEPAPASDAARDKERDQAIDRARVLSRYALVEEGDYFEVLGLPREASAHEVRRAHQALSREMSAAGLDPEVAAELDGPLRAIRAVLDEGARVLGDPRLRRRYQAQLPLASARRPE